MRVPADAIDQILKRVWPALTPQSFLWDLLGSFNRLRSGAGGDFTIEDLERIVREPAPRVAEEQGSDTDVALLDEADRLINGSGPSYAHVIVDEAQDLSAMQLRSVRARSSNGSYTIVGDIAQSTGPWARDSWDDVIEALEKDYPADLEELEFGYRVPEQIFALAARLLPHAAPGVTAPRVVRRGPSDPKLLKRDWLDVIDAAVDAAQRHAGLGRFVGIICAPEHHGVLEDLLDAREVQYDDARSGRIGQSISLMTAAEPKGLEFDARSSWSSRPRSRGSTAPDSGCSTSPSLVPPRR
jgi:DNA helicase IV